MLFEIIVIVLAFVIVASLIFLLIKKKARLDYLLNLKKWKKYRELTKKVLAYEQEMKEASDDILKNKTSYFREKLTTGETLEDILPEAYAVVREISRRKISLFPFPCQVEGAVVLHFGNVAEMKTGEGKTLTSVMPIYLNAITGEGVHVVTVNEYLAQRDAEWNKPVFNFLGLSVGVNLNDLDEEDKRKVYACDIVYTTNSELGFDYLRDHMVYVQEQKVQRKLNFVIIDEVDSVLIDEARTPLIISGNKKYETSLYQFVDRCIRNLTRKDYEIDEESSSKQIFLKPAGVIKVQKFFKIENLFAVENSQLFYFVQNALQAHYTLEKGDEYVVSEDQKIVLIDKFTGREMPGRVLSHGLHQAIEAKEEKPINPESVTAATITYQNFFRLYNKISGMTGTAKTEEEEFIKTYNMQVFVIPTNKKMIRKDENDFFFATQEEKFKALVEKVEELNKRQQPILIGTANINVSEKVAHFLTEKKLSFELLNAVNHKREAEIIAHAGELGKITVSTNMAGRGTDIKLGGEDKEQWKKVCRLGGLCVIGTERNEARRIDNQLRGRSGRQGDPGISLFYVSLEDDLFQKFSSSKNTKWFSKLFSNLETGYQSAFLSRILTKKQQQLEGVNFDIRKTLLDYDDVLSQQRQKIYFNRDQILESYDFKEIISSLHHRFVEHSLAACFTKTGVLLDDKFHELLLFYKKHNDLLGEDETKVNNFFKGLNLKKREEIKNVLFEKTYQHFLKLRLRFSPKIAFLEERRTILSVIDHHWSLHLDNVNKFRWGVNLRSYAQVNPLQVYISETNKMFKKMNKEIAKKVVIILHHRFSIKKTPFRNEMDYLTSLIDTVSQSRKAVTRYGG